MSTSFSANQYDNAFTARKLQNWQIPNLTRERPRVLNGSSRTVTANERGHLRPEFRRSNTEPWGSFIGTWDLPKKLPGNHIDVPTARSQEAYEKLQKDWETMRASLTGRPWGTTNNTLYREGTRPLAMTKNRTGSSRSCTNGYRNNNMSSSGSGLPRKLSPIQRDGGSEMAGEMTQEGSAPGSAHRTGIPLPKLDQPVYAEETEEGQVDIVAL